MVISDTNLNLSCRQFCLKRSFDFVLAFSGLTLTWWLIFAAWVLASFDTRSNGFFIQRRVGRDGRLFNMIKIKTMRSNEKLTTTVTQRGDQRITTLGAFFRKTKIDELPQLWNVLIGDMSFVGPRPDVPGFADKLEGEERVILSLRPGVTGPATIKYRNEEEILAMHDDPEVYNRNVIWPDKVSINLKYIHNWGIIQDFIYIYRTIF